MPKKQYGNAAVDVDAEGFLTDFGQWTREIAAAIAKEEGIAELTPAHWKVIEFMQKEFKENGQAPSVRKLNGGPAKKAAKISGLKKPEGCV